MAGLIAAAYRNYEELVVGKRDTRSDDIFLMYSIWQPILVVAMYLYFVLILGPRIMRNRPPYKINGIMKVYNLSQVILNIMLLTKGIEMGWFTKYKWLCEPVDYSDSPEALTAVRASWMYVMVKMFDFVDTISMVLRKRDKQITFLHVYHHAGVFFGGWLMAKYYPGGHCTLLGLINTFVHTIMYSHYFANVMWPQYKKNSLWMRKCITQLQMAQFFIVSVHAGIALIPSFTSCKYPPLVSSMFLIQNSFMFVIFTDFYRKRYHIKKA